MPQIQRWSSGTLPIPVWLLEEIEHTLNMDAAASRAEVIAAVAANKDTEVHDLLHVDEVDAVQKLRGWHRARRGTIVVDAHDLSRVRNLLDTLTYDTAECEDHLEELQHELEGVPANDRHSAHADDLETLIRFVEPAIKAREACGQCEKCRVLALRDLVDELMDAAGLPGGIYYETYGRNDGGPTAMEFWRTRVSVSLDEMRTA